MRNKFSYTFGSEYRIITLSTKVADKRCLKEGRECLKCQKENDNGETTKRCGNTGKKT